MRRKVAFLSVAVVLSFQSTFACKLHNKKKKLDIESIITEILDGSYKYAPRGAQSKKDESKWKNLVWRVSHIDDMAMGIVVGSASWILNFHKRAFKDIRKLADGKNVRKVLVKRADSKKKYVFFSDHHYLGQTKQHDYFRTWEKYEGKSKKLESLDIFKKALSEYNKDKFTYVEIGDVEDLVTIEPTWNGAFMDQLFDFFTLGLGEIADEKFEDKHKKLQLLDIFYNYRELYEMFSDTFMKENRFIKVLGNHDIRLKKPQFLSMLRKMYKKPDLEVYDYLILEPQDNQGKATGYADFIAAHGHNMDPWTNERIAKFVGEAFTQSEAWFGNGADRVWPKYKGGRGGWYKKMTPELGFVNSLARSPSLYFEKGQMAKFRHMGERNIPKRMAKAFKSAPQVPTLILGHTHEAKIDALDKKGKAYAKYVNTGATGHYEQLVWCVEVVDKVPSVFAWYVNEDKQIVKQKMISSGDGRLIPDVNNKIIF